MELNFISLNRLDWIVLAVFVIFLIWHVSNGFMRNLFALFVWVTALLAASIFSPSAQNILAPYITNTELLELVPFALIFIFAFIFLRLILVFIIVNFVTSFMNASSGERMKPLMRFLAAFSALPLIGVQFLVLLQFSRLFAIHKTKYWLDDSLFIPFALRLESYWDDGVLKWVLSPLCDNLFQTLCAA